jgi:hypothetical protein
MSDTTRKIKRKLIEIRRRFLPYNLHFRPSGVHNQEDSNAFTSFSIFPECTTALTLPGSLYKDLSQYTVYDEVVDHKPSTLSVTTNYQVYKIEGGRIFSNNVSLVSVISSDNQLVANASFQYKNGKTVTPSESPILNQMYFQKPAKYKGTVFNMLAGGGAARGNYAHWIIDVIPRLELLKQSGLFDEVDWFIVPQYRYDFQKQTLSHFGIESDRIIEGTDGLHITADCIIASSHPRGDRSFIIPQWLVDFYQTQFALDKYSDPKSPKRIYVSRKDSSLRNVVHEDEIISGLKEMGFISVELSNYDFYGKIQLFRNAEFIVSATGAGLATLLFSRKGTKVLEIFSKSYTHSFYYNISIMAGLSYDFLVFDVNDEAKDMKHGLRDDLDADPKKILAKVKTMLSTNKRIDPVK